MIFILSKKTASVIVMAKCVKRTTKQIMSILKFSNDVQALGTFYNQVGFTPIKYTLRVLFYTEMFLAINRAEDCFLGPAGHGSGKNLVDATFTDIENDNDTTAAD